MNGLQHLIIALIVAALLSVVIQLVGLIYGIKYYLKPNLSSEAALCINPNICNARKTMKEKDLPDGIWTNPEYFVLENEKKPGLFEIEQFRASRLETEAQCRAYSEKDITFYIYSKKDPKGIKVYLRQVKEILKLTSFNVKRPTLLLIHGFINSITWEFAQSIKNAAVKSTHDLNVIGVDYSPISQTCYTTAVYYAEYVGGVISDFVSKLESEVKYGIKEITVIGHSLGAHVAGFTGAKLKGRLETIIGLDPAGPLFHHKNPSKRLDPTDAKYVLVMHTNSGLLNLGTITASGHVDFYPNGGKFQPGCVFTNPLEVVPMARLCAHNRAFRYYAESLINNNFVGWRCSSYLSFVLGTCKNNPTVRMGGFPIDKGGPGKYYLYTNSKEPFAKGTSTTVEKEA